jgi:quinolinate synthase|tara:strand:- start:16268 stop:17269 length:1002 start_codon:yes stop_codon:yes gene_type:complete
MYNKEEKRELEEKGFLNKKIDPTLDLFEEIEKLKKEKNAVILAHFYQESDIQDIADFVGDSLALSQKAASTDADIILFAGVEFMAETAKILSPSKKVLLPDLNAGCSLAESCPADAFSKFKLDRPDHIVISYVNCSAEVKALTDIVCTSSNAVQIIESLPIDQKIIFGPDRNLGAYLAKETGREMAIWDGSCMVHEIFSLEKIIELKAENPGAEIIAHPECEAELLDHASYIGSTAGLLKYVQTSECETFIVATESGILHQMQKKASKKTLIPAPPNNTCACNDCPHMRLNTLEKLYNCLKYEAPEINLDESLIIAAKKPIIKMLEISKKLGL